MRLTADENEKNIEIDCLSDDRRHSNRSFDSTALKNASARCRPKTSNDLCAFGQTFCPVRNKQRRIWSTVDNESSRQSVLCFIRFHDELTSIARFISTNRRDGKKYISDYSSTRFVYCLFGSVVSCRFVSFDSKTKVLRRLDRV